MSSQDIKQGSSKERNWYAIQTNPGYENTVLKNLRNAIESWGAEDHIFNVVVPTKKILKMVRGKQQEVEEKLYPGYVLVDMIVNDKTWWIVRNTPRVSGFLGTGVHPVPISDTEMSEILDIISKEDKEIVTDFSIGDQIKIIDGTFKDNKGEIMEILLKSSEVKIKLEFFGKDTEIVVPLAQIQKI